MRTEAQREKRTVPTDRIQLPCLTEFTARGVEEEGDPRAAPPPPPPPPPPVEENSSSNQAVGIASRGDFQAALLGGLLLPRGRGKSKESDL